MDRQCGKRKYGDLEQVLEALAKRSHGSHPNTEKPMHCHVDGGWHIMRRSSVRGSAKN
jgi:hypothetical protein